MKKKIFAQTHCSLLHALHRFFVRQLFATARLGFLKLANEKETGQHWNVTIVLRAAKEKLQFDQSSAAANFSALQSRAVERRARVCGVPKQARKSSEDLHWFRGPHVFVKSRSDETSIVKC